MGNPANKSCNDCVYFGHNGRENVCKFNPPIATGGLYSETITLWPVVDPTNDWCGTFDDGSGRGAL